VPRPNPPRKRPRKRPDAQQRAARADATLTKQTAQSTQAKQSTPASKPEAPRDGAAVAAAPEMWSRRSYAVLIAIIALLQLPISTIEWAVQPAAQRGPVYLVLIGLNPISLLIAALFAVPLAKAITHEQRTLRFVESLVVGLVVFAIWFFLFTAVANVIATPLPPGTGGNSCGTASAGAVTPIPTTASASASSATPCPSPSPGASASPSTSVSPNPSSSASATASASSSATAATVIENNPRNYAVLAGINVAAFVLSIYVYPPLYKRFRLRPRPPRSSAPRGGQRSQRDAKKR